MPKRPALDRFSADDSFDALEATSTSTSSACPYLEEDDEANDPFGFDFLDRSPLEPAANKKPDENESSLVPRREEIDHNRNAKRTRLDESAKHMVVGFIKEKALTPAYESPLYSDSFSKGDSQHNVSPFDYLQKFRNPEDRKRHVFDYGMSSDIFRAMRFRDDEDRIRVPFCFENPDLRESTAETECKSDIVMSEAYGNCSVEDRRKVVTELLVRRRCFSITLETVHLGINLFDKCLDAMIVKNCSIMELACTAIVIASKIEEVNALTFRDVAVSNIIHCSPELLLSLERLIYNVLDFKVSLPTALGFANLILIHLNAALRLVHMTQYILNLALIDINFRHFSSAELAHAAVSVSSAISKHVDAAGDEVVRVVEKKMEDFCLIRPKTTRNIMSLLFQKFLTAQMEQEQLYVEYSRDSFNNVALSSIDKSLVDLLSS